MEQSEADIKVEQFWKNAVSKIEHLDPGTSVVVCARSKKAGLLCRYRIMFLWRTNPCVH